MRHSTQETRISAATLLYKSLRGSVTFFFKYSTFFPEVSRIFKNSKLRSTFLLWRKSDVVQPTRCDRIETAIRQFATMQPVGEDVNRITDVGFISDTRGMS